jgi:hypothetical protein
LLDYKIKSRFTVSQADAPRRLKETLAELSRKVKQAIEIARGIGHDIAHIKIITRLFHGSEQVEPRI